MAFADMLQRRNRKQLSSAAALLALTASSSYVFLLNLAPVYGSAPSHIFHGYGVAIVAAAGWFLKDRVQQLSARRAVFLLPVMAFWVPTIQYFLFQQSSQLGNPTGPLITTAVAFYPFLLLSVACAGKMMQSGLNLDRHGDLVSDDLAGRPVYSGGRAVDSEDGKLTTTPHKGQAAIKYHFHTCSLDYYKFGFNPF